jgi:hypothetical protein
MRQRVPDKDVANRVKAGQERGQRRVRLSLGHQCDDRLQGVTFTLQSRSGILQSRDWLALLL